jgi:predicted amidohydrolase YtcJ
LFADLVLSEGKIVTVSDEELVAESVAAKFGRILAVGSTDEINQMIGPKTYVIELKGRTVIPGLIDSHCHMVSLAALSRALNVIDGSYEAGVRSISDLKAMIASQTKRVPKGEWINVVGEDETKLVEKRHPTKRDLDDVARVNPVMVTTVGEHFSIVNSKAFEIAGVTRDTPDPMGGRFEKDPRSGELTGWIHERAAEAVQPTKYGRNPTLQEAMDAVCLVANEYVASGLTCINDGWISQAVLVRALHELRVRNRLPIRIRLDFWYEMLPHLIALGIGEGFGDGMLRICAIKIVADGAISARTAAVAEPYLHRPDYRGELSITKEELNRIIMEGYSRGYRFSVHANGERAIEMVLDVIEQAQAKHPRNDPRNRIIHCTVVTPEIVARIRKLGVLPTIFGPYPYYHGDKILDAFGPKRLERMFAARTFLDAGIKVSAHSDNTAAPHPPLMGIHALVNRETAKGKPAGISQKISVMEAIRLYTIYAAYHTFEENIMGSIEPGKYADMVILGEDILSVEPETIMNIPIDVTIVGGRVVFTRAA